MFRGQPAMYPELSQGSKRRNQCQSPATPPNGVLEVTGAETTGPGGAGPRKAKNGFTDGVLPEPGVTVSQGGVQNMREASHVRWRTLGMEVTEFTLNSRIRGVMGASAQESVQALAGCAIRHKLLNAPHDAEWDGVAVNFNPSAFLASGLHTRGRAHALKVSGELLPQGVKVARHKKAETALEDGHQWSATCPR